MESTNRHGALSLCRHPGPPQRFGKFVFDATQSDKPGHLIRPTTPQTGSIRGILIYLWKSLDPRGHPLNYLTHQTVPQSHLVRPRCTDCSDPIKHDHLTV